MSGDDSEEPGSLLQLLHREARLRAPLRVGSWGIFALRLLERATLALFLTATECPGYSKAVGGRLPPYATSSLAGPGTLGAMASRSGPRHAPSTDMAKNFGSNIRRTLILVSASDRHRTPWDAGIFRGPSTCGPNHSEASSARPWGFSQPLLCALMGRRLLAGISLMCRLFV